MVVNIQTKHDAWTKFFLITFMGRNQWHEFPHSNAWEWHVILILICLIPELLILMIAIPTPIPLKLIPILIPIPGFTKIHDSHSNFNSSSKWFRFRLQGFPKYLIPILIPIPIPAPRDSDSNSDSNKQSFDSD